MATKRSADFWKHHIHAWSKSGLSQCEYARNHELPVKTFSYHKRPHFNPKAAPALDSNKPQPLIPVSVAQEPVPQKASETGVTLVSPGGIRVELTTGFDPMVLGQILQILEVA